MLCWKEGGINGLVVVDGLVVRLTQRLVVNRLVNTYAGSAV